MEELIRRVTQTRVLVVLAVIFIGAFFLTKAEADRTKSIVVPTPTPFIFRRRIAQAAAQNSRKFDLNSQYECGDASSSATISKKRLYITSTKAKQKSYVVFNGDCVYSWMSGAKAGTKKCGYGQMVRLYDSFAGLGGIDSNMIIDTLSGTGLLNVLMPASQSAGLSTQGLQKKFLSSCRETTSVNEKLFEVPKTVTFTETKQK
jgi:hypothetical protein